jgi:hypothetical protein
VGLDSTGLPSFGGWNFHKNMELPFLLWRRRPRPVRTVHSNPAQLHISTHSLHNPILLHTIYTFLAHRAYGSGGVPIFCMRFSKWASALSVSSGGSLWPLLCARSSRNTYTSVAAPAHANIKITAKVSHAHWGTWADHVLKPGGDMGGGMLGGHTIKGMRGGGSRGGGSVGGEKGGGIGGDNGGGIRGYPRMLCATLLAAPVTASFTADATPIAPSTTLVAIARMRSLAPFGHSCLLPIGLPLRPRWMLRSPHR